MAIIFAERVVVRTISCAPYSVVYTGSGQNKFYDDWAKITSDNASYSSSVSYTTTSMTTSIYLLRQTTIMAECISSHRNLYEQLLLQHRTLCHSDEVIF